MMTSGGTIRTWPGKPYPLGATWDGMGVNFALFSENAEKVELCLFDTIHSTKESHRIVLLEYTDQVWHAYLPDVQPGQLYGYRVYGRYDPTEGLRFNPNKLLVDPYAKAIARGITWDDSMFGYTVGQKNEDLHMDGRDNAQFAPLAAVIDSAFTWGDDRRPNIPWHKTIIYEAHVKGLTMLHPDIPKDLRGTYAGVTTEPILRHLQSLGVTAIELMPVHHKVDEKQLIDRGLRNYWGYNTLGYFAPDMRYTSHPETLAHVREFKMMVRALHSAGIEVILDVVYNHTAEGNHLGPTLSFRGIDNTAYYRVLDHSARYYEDFTGCGNTLNMRHPRVLQLIMDSLRYWVVEMHVDGFRFDLASALARELYEVNQLAAFFEIIHQDPILSQVKLIAEPWDLGQGGYQVGNFPVLWTEWNGQFRDSVRSFWVSGGSHMSELATRFAGSSDLYGGERKPYASINFLTCHDGFSLQDLVSYNHKHNEANGEDNRDGNNDNRSWNCGEEGATENQTVLSLRARQKRNLITTLFLSAGVPMLSGGDELSKTQYGNNNAYCHDNELSWYPWDLGEEDEKFLRFVRRLIKLRKDHPVLQRRKFFTGEISPSSGMKDISWYTPSGTELTLHDWHNPSVGALGVCLSGDSLDELDEFGRRVSGGTLLLLMNFSDHTVDFTLPNYGKYETWLRLFDTFDGDILFPSEAYRFGSSYQMSPRTTVLFEVNRPEFWETLSR